MDNYQQWLFKCSEWYHNYLLIIGPDWTPRSLQKGQYNDIIYTLCVTNKNKRTLCYTYVLSSTICLNMYVYSARLEVDIIN